MQQKALNQEIELMELLAKFYRLLKSNRLLVIILPVLGLLAALAISSLSMDSVKTSMMISTDLISENEAKFLAEQLEKADTIQGLKENEQKLVKSIAYEVKKGEQADKTIYMQLVAVIYDKEILSRLQTAIVDYLNRSEPVIRHRIEKEKFYGEMIKKIDTELVALGQVKDLIDNKTKATFLSPSDLFSKTVDLFEKRVSYQVALEEIRSVHVVKGFGSLTKSAKWSKLVYALVGILAGVFVLFVILFVKFFSQYYKAFEETKQVE